MAVFASIIEALNTWHIGGVSFASTAESKDYREFAYLFVSLDPENMPSPICRKPCNTPASKALNWRNPEHFSCNIWPKAKEPPENRNTPGGSTPSRRTQRKRRALAKGRYAKAASALGDLTKNTRAGGTVSFKQAKRAIQNIVELLMQDESTLLGLTNLRCHDQYTHNHSVNVSLLAMALGNRAGYPKSTWRIWACRPCFTTWEMRHLPGCAQ